MSKQEKKEGGRYQCQKCGEKFDELPKGVFRCPSCAYKIIVKLRQPIVRKLKAE
ncbi:DNA-directed RNA polymerase subunit P [Candidatus Micrarchaeota archaeon]|nr:DNA-directed RNA polymerase subunit P [Candidatus Micrarchaeota archaeon]MBU2475986.1 DNA-directed RNA polymerase subunit P [Candidatus Micrarchaeota archaeon]